MNRKNFGSLALAALVACWAASARAATITWDATATNVNQNAPTQVALLPGFHFFSAATLSSTTTINGATFQGYSSHTGAGPYNLQFGTSNITVNTVDPATPQTYSSAGTTPYGSMLNEGTYRGSTDMTINIGNLTVGNHYAVQLWTPYWNAQYPTSFTAGNSTPFLNTGSGVPPQFIVGTFIANATTETISTAGNNTYALFSAISVQASPEPSSLLLCGLGALGLLIAGRRRRKA